MAERSPAAPRCAAIVGPYLTGKTTLLESLLFATGAVGRKGSAREGNTVGDSAAEARARKMSVEMSAASTRVPRRALDLPRLSGLGRALPGGAERADGRRCGDRGLRGGDGQGADAGAAVQVPRRSQDPPYAFRQQDRHRRIIACARSWRRCRPSPPARWCCARCPCAAPTARGRRSSPAMSISSASAPMATSRARPPS